MRHEQDVLWAVESKLFVVVEYMDESFLEKMNVMLNVLGD